MCSSDLSTRFSFVMSMNCELALAAVSMRNVDLFVVSFNGGVLDIFNVHLTAI